jgi:2,3-bisphosphoglycerate-independent phosphoglycerate mutase
MDRDRRWERIARSYRTLVQGEGAQFASADAGIAAAYAAGTTDEFIEPFTVGTDPAAGCIRPGDAVLCFNFRTDRCREITEALAISDFPEHGMQALPLHYTTMTRYDERWTNIHVLYDKPNLAETLGEVVAAAGRTQIRIAETEKYPHVTYFFSGGREEPFPGERRLMASSPKVATYDLAPAMSAAELTSTLVPELRAGQADFVCLNFANPDMVGHTGVFEAIVAAVEFTDACLGKVLDAAEAGGYAWVVLADHGNADLARNPDGTPHTAHTTHPVPVIVHAPSITAVRDGSLPDVAPTLLRILGLPQPEAMTGRSLI